jgi:hypothetical protein
MDNGQLGGRKMKHLSRRRSIVVAGLAVPVVAAACGGRAALDGAGTPAVVEKPAAVKNVSVDGKPATRVILSAAAARRLDIHTARVRSDGNGRLVVPYGAVLYDPDGATWTYTNPDGLVFVRHDISVDRIDGKRAFLRKGPAVGTRVVTVGATELWGVEYGGIEED